MSYLNDTRILATAKAINYMTPNKSIMSIDTTISHAKPQKNFSFSTPRSKSTQHDEDSLLTPIIKKSKRRDCTPIENQQMMIIEDLNDYDPISRTRFMETLERTETNNDESNEIVSKIKGSYLLNCLDNNNTSLYNIILSDSQIFNEVVNMICVSFFEGYNNRSHLFFKFMVILY
jgi:hypothetical protein